ncbi:MAG: hypothetical protein H0V82_09990 [Candidatus Protochlamydia sp.]|nr:hypothetical protein [Candidatus Protochlamydia sp.]
MKNYFLIVIFFSSLLSLLVYSPKSSEDLKEEARGITRTLIRDLQKIRTRDRLITSSKNLQELFSQLAEVMKEAQDFHSRHPGEIALIKADHELSDLLRMELERIYRIEGGRQIIEKCQEHARALLEEKSQ